MAILAYTQTNTRFLLLALVLSLVTGLAMQKFSPALIVVLYVLPFLIILFYYYPMALISLWLVLFFVSAVFPDMMNEVGSFFLIPMDPAYFFSVILLIIYALTRTKEFVRAIKVNPFLIIFLAVILGYILINMPVHGKSALGEARKFYFIYFLPLLMLFSTKTSDDLRRLLVLTFFLTLALLVTSLLRFIMGSHMRALANAQMALVFLLMLFSVLILHINGSVIFGRVIDITVLVFCLIFILLTQHRSVIIAAAFGLLLICILARNKILFYSKMAFSLLAFFAVIGLIFINNPEFEDITVKRLSGIVNPSSDITGSWRMKGWSRQLTALSTNDFFFGQGLGSYYQAFNTFGKSYKRGPETMSEPHNAYIQIIANFGLLGLVIYELLAFWFFWKIFAVRRILPRGIMRGYVEISIINFAAGQAFMVGYGFCLPLLIFLGMGMSTIKLLEDSLQVGEQDEEWKMLQA
jgi:O-antigen ligase